MEPNIIPTAIPVMPQPERIPHQNLNLSHKETLFNVASRALPLASQLIADKERRHVEKEAVIIHHHRHYSYGYWGWGSPFWFRPQPVVILDRGYRREERDNGLVLLGLFATIGFLFASAAVGSAMARLKDSNRELEKTSQDKTDLPSFQGDFSEDDQVLINTANEVMNLRERICKRIKNSAAWDLALRISLTVGLAFVAAAAFVNCPPVLGLAVIGTVVISCALLFKQGFDSTDRQNYVEAQKIRDRVTFLNAQFAASV